MEREKQIKEMVKEMLEISTSANVEPVLEIDGKEIVLGESATRVLDNILEQAFIPYLAEKLYNAGYRKVVMCKDCVYCEEHHYEEEGEKPYIKLTCKWRKYAHIPTDFCSFAKMKGAE